MKTKHTLSKLKTVVPNILTVIILTAFLIYLVKNVDRYWQLLNLSPYLIGWAFALSVLLMFTNGLINFFLYRGLGVPLTINEGFGLASVNSLANLLPFAGGMIANGIYLKRKHQLAYTHFLSATMALYVCFVAANGVVGLALLRYWKLVDKTNLPILLFIGFLVMAASIIVLWLPLDLDLVSDKWQQRLLQLMQGWYILVKNRWLIAELVGIQLLMTLIFAARIWISFHLLSQNVTLAQCVLFSAATILTNLVSITPGGLGVREVIVAAVATVLGFDADISILAVGIDRLVATLVIIILGTIYTYVLTNQAMNTSPSISES